VGNNHHFDTTPEDIPPRRERHLAAQGIENEARDEQHNKNDTRYHRKIKRIQPTIHIEKVIQIKWSINQYNHRKGEWNHQNVQPLHVKPIENI
jgi:hypothetical protein